MPPSQYFQLHYTGKSRFCQVFLHTNRRKWRFWRETFCIREKHPVDAFLNFDFFPLRFKSLEFPPQVFKKRLFEAIFSDFAIRASFFTFQKANLQRCSGFSAPKKGRALLKTPFSGSILTPVAEIFEIFLQNMGKKAAFSIDIGFWI